MIRYAALLTAVVFAGCTGSAGSQSPLAPTGAQGGAPPIQAVVQAQSRAVSPATCDTGVHVMIQRQDSAFRMPRCDGWRGEAFGYYDPQTRELATIAWRSGDIENAAILERQYSVIARLTLGPSGTAHVVYGYTIAPSLAAARAQLAAAEAGAQGRNDLPANWATPVP